MFGYEPFRLHTELKLKYKSICKQVRAIRRVPLCNKRGRSTQKWSQWATSRAPPTGRCQSDEIHLGDKSTLFQSTVRRVHCVLISLFDVPKINYRVSTASLTRPPSHPRWSISAFYILICLEMTFTNKLYQGGPEVFILFYLSKVRKCKFRNVLKRKRFSCHG